jgi:hypothetical protein
MGRPKKKTEPDTEIGAGDTGGEYARPNAERAAEIYDDHISPKLTQINTIKGDLKEPWQMLKDEANFPRKEFNYLQSLVEEDDDVKRQHRLRALKAGLEHYGLAVEPDLVDNMEGHNSANVVQFGAASAPFVPGVTDDDDDSSED